MTGIVGSGFGLYGYLPAVLYFDQQVCLLDKAKSRLTEHKELNDFYPRIKWFSTLDNFLTEIDTLIIATPPAEQSKLVGELAKYPGIKNVIIEKPIAITPGEGDEILSFFERKGINFRVSYSFIYQDWFHELQEKCLHTENTQLEISWYFKAHHYKTHLNNWKRYNSQGGGALRFFGIHLIALMSILGYNDVVASEVMSKDEEDFSLWAANLRKEQNTVSLVVDTDNSRELFEIVLKAGGVPVYKLSAISPFKDQKPVEKNGLDNRVATLAEIYADLINNTLSENQRTAYAGINSLWRSIESKSVIKNANDSKYNYTNV